MFKCFGYVFLFFSALTFAQEHPPVINYTPNIYEGDNQNWMLTQALDKTIYIANNKGLLAFNGAQWHLYPSPNKTIIRAVKAVDSKVYSGAYMDFGVWKKNSVGVLEYKSIAVSKNLAMVEDEHIWNIEQYRQYILFQSLDRIYIYDTNEDKVQIISPNGKITRLFLVNENLFFQVKGEGLYSIEKGEAIPYIENDILKYGRLIDIFKFNGKLVGITESDGFFILDRDNIKPWDAITTSLWNEINIYSAIQRKNGSIVLGTIENGIIQLSQQGGVEFKIKKGNGLNNNTALSLLEDQDENLWIGLDAGIDCVNRQGQFNQYIDIKGTLGTIYASAVQNGYLYLGTNQGLFYRKENSLSDFERIAGTEGQVWSLSIIDNTLFCGHNNGTFVIEEQIAKKIADIEGTWSVKKIPNAQNLLMQGNFDGLYVLEKRNGSWKVRNKVENFINSSKHFEIVNSETILVSHEYKGVFEIKTSPDFNKALNVLKHSNLEVGEHSSLSRLGKTIFYANKKGIYTYNTIDNNFVREESLSKIFTDDSFVTGKLIEDGDKLWGFTKSDLVNISRDKLDDSYSIDRISIPSSYRNTVEGYETFVRFRESEYLLGTSNGYLIVDIHGNAMQEYNISLNGIMVNNLGGDSKLVTLSNEGEFASKFNNISFSYSVPEFDKFLTTEYAYFLEGFYDKWSAWTTESNASFENLPFGSYIFKVKARVGGIDINDEKTYKFTINRPWYLSNTMIIIYAFSTILLFTALNGFYKRYYKRQQALALERSKRDMEMKALESEKQIIQLNNTNLKQDIDARNRELAVSTMNMINKSKTLNTIKSALLKVKKIDDVNDIVSIVDNTIENEEDWNFFEKAFNHADKDFFRKVKDKHPSLTANDLKLCVYLRLNMSSKEIAPLLNISSRSVEIKRYRLRKKLDLSRDVNLNDYFINL